MLDEYRRQYVIIIIGAMMLVISLLWKDFLVDLQERLFPSRNGVWDDFLFVAGLTTVAVIVAVLLRKKMGIKPSNTI